MASSKKKRAARKTEDLRASLWPELDTDLLWDAGYDDGYTPVPRTMPIIMAIINDLTKGKPSGPAFLELWCRAYNEMYVSLGAAAALATHSGYSGLKAVRMWQERIEKLETLGFILTKNGSAGRFSHAVILNPHKVIRKLYEAGHSGVTKEKYEALAERANEVGSEDFKVKSAATAAA
ncbi:hypothetical protein [Rhizobium leguminosarum]|uniref:hypothetical protein n=1 Tax=Rhizobium leguminosarum TaxID=384 RepID=UPI0010373475|nr:hypothetical protein [Rhizobium leguminosarum]TBF85692.1 hypothetical protein ELG85_37165 [Rhizobium leguminosarum]